MWEDCGDSGVESRVWLRGAGVNPVEGGLTAGLVHMPQNKQHLSLASAAGPFLPRPS